MAQLKSVEEIRKDDAQKFLDYLQPTKKRWGEGLDSPWIFRGHGDASWVLQPRAWRRDGKEILKPIQESLKPYLEEGWRAIQNWPSKDETIKRLISKKPRVLAHLLEEGAELEAVRRFTSLVDELGLPLLEAESPYLRGGVGFVRNPMSAGWPNTFAFTKNESARAQHHGIPTRLLDWTRKSRVAAFFAAESCIMRSAKLAFGQKQSARPGGSDCLAVWAVNCGWLKPKFSTRKSMLEVMTLPRYQDSFLHAQDGLFIRATYTGETSLVHPGEFYLKYGKWPTFDYLIEEVFKRERDQSGPPLRKVMLPANQAGKLLELLWHERVSRAHLMPAYDNITTTLKIMWSETFKDIR